MSNATAATSPMPATVAERASALLPGMATTLATAPIKLDQKEDCARELRRHYLAADVETLLSMAIGRARRIRAAAL